jgi:N4-(beta-N-acetylglucosaminyl)-L-asparaginase
VGGYRAGAIFARHKGAALNKLVTRRTFILTGTAGGVSAAASSAYPVPTIVNRFSIRPVVISSANGNRFKNGGDKTCIETAFEMITKGSDVLDALIAGVNIVELDPKDPSVGYGGIPNAEGVVQLDSCCMHGPRKRAGGVAAIEGVRTPSLVARVVMDQTDHHLIVGKDASRFAHSMGFKVEDDLNTELSRRLWLEWKRRTDPGHYLDPNKRADGSWPSTSTRTIQERGFEVARQMAREGLIDPAHLYGTINCNGINAKGEICGVTTTSGLAFKIPGRVGDSPILGAGLYVDGEVGAAGSTGRGEANLYNLCSHLIVEEMRRGAHPKDAAMTALKRVAANTVEKRLLNSRKQPNFQLQFYVVNAGGDYAGVSMYGSPFAVCTDSGPKTIQCEALFSGRPED